MRQTLIAIVLIIILAAGVALSLGKYAEAAGRPQRDYTLTVLSGGKVMKTYVARGRIEAWHRGYKFTTVRGDVVYVNAHFVVEPKKARKGGKR